MSQQDRNPQEQRQQDSGKRISSVQDIRRRKARRKRLITLTAVVLVIAVSVLGITLRQRASAAAAAEAERATAAHEVTARTFRQEVEVSGHVAPYRSADLTFRVGGEVREVHVSEGDEVSAGDVLAVLRTRTKEYELAQLEHEIEQAAFEGSAKELELLQMRMGILEEEIQDSYLRSRIDGTISRVSIETGDRVSASEPEAAVRVVDLSMLKATVEVDEFDITAVRRGQEAQLVFDALGSDRPVIAQVHAVPIEGIVTGQGIAVKEVELIAEDPPDEISPAYTFSGSIFVSEAREVLVFPQDFLIRDRSGQQVLRRGSDGEVESVQVRTQYFEAGLVRIISGDISEGDVIIRQPRIPEGSSGGFSFPGARR